jgi:5'-methylthioadenosine phosphorylase
VIAAWGRAVEAPLVEGGVYWQAIGPRFETPAEIRMIAPHADVIGMTIASECILAGEMGIPYAVVCVVDNLANGVAPTDLTVADFEAGKARSQAFVTAAVGALGSELLASGGAA